MLLHTARMAKTTIKGDAFFINFVVIKLPSSSQRTRDIVDFYDI